MSNKVDYVKSQGQTRPHRCHWPECTAQVPPAMWGCKPHWFMLPPAIRTAIWAAYRPGQEVNGTPSKEYLLAAQDAEEWIRTREAERQGLPRTADIRTRDLFGDQ